jgi:agmatinase
MEFGSSAMTREFVPNRQGIPCFLGSTPAYTTTDLGGADLCVLGIPYVSPIVGFENDLAPRNVRIAGLRYGSTFLPEFGLDPMATLKVVDWGDVELPFGDLKRSLGLVEEAVEKILDAGALPITLGGNAPCAGYSVAKALVERWPNQLGVVSLDGHCDTSPEQGEEPNSSNWVRSMYLTIPNMRLQNHVQAGIRGMNNARDRVAFYTDRHMRVITAWEAMKMGPERFAEEAVTHAANGVAKIWLAIDMDVFDISATPDWILPDPMGLTTRDVLTTAYAAGRTGKLAGISIMMVAGLKESVHWMVLFTVMYALAGLAEAGKSR